MDTPTPGTGEPIANNSESGTLDAAIEAEMRALERTTGRPHEDAKQGKQQPQGEAGEEGAEGPDNASGEDDPEQADPDNPDEPDPDAAADPDDEAAKGEVVEFEHEGQRYRVPKELEGALMMRADYTRGKQWLAQEQTRLESDRQQVRAMYDQSGPHLAQLAEFNSHKAEHDRLMKTNWAELEGLDITEYSRRTGRLQLLAARMGQLDGEIRTTRQNLEQQDHEADSRRVQEAQVVMQKIWPSFTPEDASRLGQFARTCGVRPETIAYLDKGHDPVAMRLLDFAFNHVVALRNKPAAMQKVADAKPILKVGNANAGVQNRGTRNVEKFGSRLKATGGIHDAVALELAHEQRKQQRRPRGR